MRIEERGEGGARGGGDDGSEGWIYRCGAGGGGMWSIDMSSLWLLLGLPF